MKMTLKIGGMHCAACSRAVERALKKTDGIEEANVNIATEKAVFNYDEKKLKYDDIRLGIRFWAKRKTQPL